MKDKIFAVIDTNVIVSALLSSNLESNPVKVFRAIVQERIVPLYNDEILEEYKSVLSRPKFHLNLSLIERDSHQSHHYRWIEYRQDSDSRYRIPRPERHRILV